MANKIRQRSRVAEHLFLGHVKPSKSLLLALLLLPPAILCHHMARPHEASDSSKGKQYRQINIDSIWENPAALRGQPVLLRGRFVGWKCESAHPGITRSDWAMQDQTGCIYVTGIPPGSLKPVKDIGCPLVLMGTVEISAKGVPYIRGDKVIPSKTNSAARFRPLLFKRKEVIGMILAQTSLISSHGLVVSI